MPATVIATRVNLPGKIVVSTACRTGAKAFAEAFVKGKVAAYIAPDGYPHGADAPLFVHQLFHQLLQRRVSLPSALYRSQTYDDAHRMFQIYPAPSAD
jgi:hypothetical protein